MHELPELSNNEIRRYSRHLILPEVGVPGQRKLKAASVLIVGAGGLGAPAAMYLAAAGVGHIGLIDADRVDESNLQRQIIHGQSTLDRLKVESARDRLRDINPFVQVTTFADTMRRELALDMIKDFDIVIDCTDNFPTRYLVNDACVLLGKPYIYGSIFRFEGQASVFDAKRGPCYRCLFPEPPPPGMVPSCAEAGVIGVLPGVIGTLQATETVKLIIGQGEPLIGRLMLYDALDARFSEVKLRKDPKCPICGGNPSITGLVDYDYDAFCGIPAPGTAETKSDAMLEVTVHELKQRLDAGLDKTRTILLDVREPNEWDIAVIPHSRKVPKAQVKDIVHELAGADEIIVHCRSGVRSAEVVQFLRKEIGWRNVKNLKGGILAWSDAIDPSVAKY
jgi:adenylyltransferase/sulfurtransferase